jgi:alpha-tubulin suppressor-like RCC1 family protein
MFAITCPLPHIVALAVLFGNGRVMCWGWGATGQPGLDSVTSVGAPGTMGSHVYVEFSDTIPASQISANGRHACALLVNSRVRCWGKNSEQQLGNRSTNTIGSAAGVNSIRRAEAVVFAPSINTLAVTTVVTGTYTPHS